MEDKPKKSAVNGTVQCDVKLNGKTVLITGANQGIGFETALDLAGRGARVILACRDLEKAEAAKEKIKETVSPSDIVVMKLDLASLDSIREFSKAVNENESHLDILINNAGIMACPQWKTADGFEMHLGTNHIGHFLLTELLLDLLKKSAPSRIVIVSSSGYKRGKMDWNNMMHETNYDPFYVYCCSKLANVHHCLELSRRLEGTGVTCNSLHPGIIKTNLGQYMRGDHTPFFRRMLYTIAWPLAMAFFMTPKQGTQTSIYCSIAPELADVTGKYFAKCGEEPLMTHALNKEDAKKLWELSEKWIAAKETAD
ncbi:retinol dehydrogenase 14-like isoform X2 [Clavelina lepadiformis]|uniref:retinol dehydrogenase 14-like isoform X2 n=1 Tax=Clavelina lepadiformis TaxID=159417 RepID=UPI004041CB97